MNVAKLLIYLNKNAKISYFLDAAFHNIPNLKCSLEKQMAREHQDQKLAL
jgi:hypothetical protein